MRTSEQFYLLGSQSFQDMNDWVNCLRLVAFGQAASSAAGNGTPALASIVTTGSAAAASLAAASAAVAKRSGAPRQQQQQQRVDVLLQEPARKQDEEAQQASSTQAALAAKTASQAAAAAASALAKTRQRQPSLLGSCKPLPPNDSPFIRRQQIAGSGASSASNLLSSIGQVDTLTPTVCGQLIGAACSAAAPKQAALQPSTALSTPNLNNTCSPPARLLAHKTLCSSMMDVLAATTSAANAKQQVQVPATLDEEEENMLYCSIEDNPSEHNYRVKVIETELALRCQLKCYQLSGPSLVSEQYEELSQFRAGAGPQQRPTMESGAAGRAPVVTFYQLIIGPQELTLLNDYAAAAHLHKHHAGGNNQQGLWSWPYQCIRRYGFDKDNCFMFEAGRKCASGPGQFVVQTPKAYSIYQDVVKFVNELRTITGAPEQPMLQLQQLAQVQRHKSVTQIPVVWAPEQRQAGARGAGEQEAPGGSEENSERRLFEAKCNEAVLRQGLQQKCAPPSPAGPGSLTPPSERARSSVSSSSVSSSSSDQESQPPLAGSVTNQPQTQVPDARPASANKNTDKTQMAAMGGGSDETDESGYEQGDDQRSTGSSAGHGRTRPKPPTAAGDDSAAPQVPLVARTRRQPQPLDATNTRASEQRQQQQATRLEQKPAPDKGKKVRTIVEQSGGSVADRVRALGLHDLLTDSALVPRAQKPPSLGTPTAIAPQSQQPAVVDDDLEANLIRDVYCEITKLHAKFALTTNGSSDDSMSSRSSSSSSGGDPITTSASRESSVGTMSLDNRLAPDGGDFEEEDDEIRLGASDHLVGGKSVPSEPMYSNVEAEVELGREMNQVAPLQYNGQNRGKQAARSTNGHQVTRHFNAHGSGAQANGQPVDSRPYEQSQNSGPAYPLRGGLNNASLNRINNHDTFNDYNLNTLTSNRHQYQAVLNPIPECGDDEPSMGTMFSKNGARCIGPSTRKPTNHYVINDVQYAKISRNLLR